MQKTRSFSIHSHLIIDLFTPPSTGATPDRRGQHGRLLSHVYSLPMGVDGPYGRPLQPRTPRDTKPRSFDTNSPRSHTEHALRDRETHSESRTRYDTDVRRRHCNGCDGGAGDGAVGCTRSARCLRTATAQTVSAMHNTHRVHGRGHGHMIWWANLCAPPLRKVL